MCDKTSSFALTVKLTFTLDRYVLNDLKLNLQNVSPLIVFMVYISTQYVYL